MACGPSSLRRADTAPAVVFSSTTRPGPHQSSSSFLETTDHVLDQRQQHVERARSSTAGWPSMTVAAAPGAARCARNGVIRHEAPPGPQFTRLRALQDAFIPLKDVAPQGQNMASPIARVPVPGARVGTPQERHDPLHCTRHLPRPHSPSTAIHWTHSLLRPRQKPVTLNSHAHWPAPIEVAFSRATAAALCTRACCPPSCARRGGAGGGPGGLLGQRCAGGRARPACAHPRASLARPRHPRAGSPHARPRRIGTARRARRGGLPARAGRPARAHRRGRRFGGRFGGGAGRGGRTGGRCRGGRQPAPAPAGGRRAPADLLMRWPAGPGVRSRRRPGAPPCWAAWRHCAAVR